MPFGRLSPASAQVFCQGQSHRLRWAGGSLQALDHDDIDGEITLAALGGEPARCAEIVTAWRAAQDDLRVLVLASRGGTDQLSPSPPEPGLTPGGRAAGGQAAGSQAASSQFGWFAYAPMGARATMSSQRYAGVTHPGAAPDMPRPDPLAMLLKLGGGIPDRLVAAVLSNWAARLESAPAPAAAVPALTAALTGRARMAVSSWLSTAAGDVDVTMLPPGATPVFQLTDGLATVGLSFEWLAQVWALGLTQMLGRFTLAVHDDGQRLVLDTVGAEFDRASIVIESGSTTS